MAQDVEDGQIVESRFELFPRGFIFTEVATAPPREVQHFIKQETELGILWHHPALEVALRVTPNAVVVILGHAAYVPLYKDSILVLDQIVEKVAEFHYNETELHDFLYDLAGRYAVLIITNEGGRVYHDAHGMRSVYIDKINNAISSHIGLLKAYYSPASSSSKLSDLTLPYQFDQTSFKHVTPLVPNHYFDLSSKIQKRYFPLQNNRFTDFSYDEKVDYFIDIWQKQLAAYSKKYSLVMSLTGGLDSRTSLALAKPIWPSMHTFTYTTDPVPDDKWSSSLDKDRVIVEQILDSMILSHSMLKRESSSEYSSADEWVLNSNSAGQHGRWILDLYMREVTPRGNMHLRANLLETARNYYAKFADETAEYGGLLRLIEASLSGGKNRKHYTKNKSIIDDDISSALTRLQFDLVHSDYNYLDIYYWEIRMGRWVSEVFNETDVAFDTFIPFNVRSLIDIGLSMNDEIKSTNQLFTDAINKTAPVLNFFGINELSNLYEYKRELASSTTERRNDFPLEHAGTFAIRGTDAIEIDQSSHSIQVPLKYLTKGTVVRKNYTAIHDMNLRVGIFNEYFNTNGFGYLKLNVYVNGSLAAENDISQWKYPFGVTIPGITMGDTLAIEMHVLRNCSAKSWQTASTTEFTFDVWEGSVSDQVRSDNPFTALFRVKD